MKRSTIWQRVAGFVMGKGFYIVLFLCVATIGISGYYLVSAFSSGIGQVQQTGADRQITLPDPERSAARPVVPDAPGGAELGDASEAAPPEPQIISPAEPVKEKEPAKQTEPARPSKQTSAQPAQQPAAPTFTWPVRGEIISNFSLEVLAYDETMGDWRTHSGVDIAAEQGTRVQAISNGRVSRVYQDDLMGWTVVIQHADGLVSCYQNLDKGITVSEGNDVVTGTVIGTVGDTAIAERSRPSHLHLEMSRDGRAVNPADYLPRY